MDYLVSNSGAAAKYIENQAISIGMCNCQRLIKPLAEV